jgi:FAD/FMN-containing dehydrogenase
MTRALTPFHVTTYLNNAMPENENEMRRVFPEETMKRLQALKKKHDPDGIFKTGAWH